MTIEDEDAYDAALADAAALTDAETNTPEGLRLDALSGTNKSADGSSLHERIRRSLDELARGEVVFFEDVFGEPL